MFELCWRLQSRTGGHVLRTENDIFGTLSAVFDLETYSTRSFLGAGKAWPRSEHTGSLLPTMLRGKSSCLGAESATGRPEDLNSGAYSEAHVEL